MGSVAWKVLAAVSGIVAGKAASAATNSVWKAATGKQAPKGKHDPTVSNKEAAIFAIISTAAIGAAKVFAERKAADYYTKSAGHPPAPVVKQQEKAIEKKQDA